MTAFADSLSGHANRARHLGHTVLSSRLHKISRSSRPAIGPDAPAERTSDGIPDRR